MADQGGPIRKLFGLPMSNRGGNSSQRAAGRETAHGSPPLNTLLEDEEPEQFLAQAGSSRAHAEQAAALSSSLDSSTSTPSKATDKVTATSPKTRVPAKKRIHPAGGGDVRKSTGDLDEDDDYSSNEEVEVRASDVDWLMERRSCGYNALDLRGLGATVASLRSAGFTARSLRGAGLERKELELAGFSPEALELAGYNTQRLTWRFGNYTYRSCLNDEEEGWFSDPSESSSRARETWSRSFAAIKQANQQGVRPWEEDDAPAGPTFEEWQSKLKGNKAARAEDSEHNVGSSVRGGADAGSDPNMATTPRDEALRELEA